MAFCLSAMLVLIGLTGIHSLTSVSKVSVKAGGSISIPCLYSKQDVNLVKYLCEGYYWTYCKYVAQTNKPHNSGKFSIFDDKTQGIFTVTIRQLTNENSYFWCSFQYPGGSYNRKFFELSVTSGTPSLYVDSQKATGFIGENATITCHSTSRQISWCRIGRECVTSPSGSIDGTAVYINKTGHNVFTVTMSGLRQQDSGWYWCASGDLQMPVHVTVTERPTTFSSISFEVTTSGEIGQHSTNSFDLTMLIIPLSLLILIVISTLLIWLVLKRKHTKAESSSAMTNADEEVTYCNVTHKRKPSVQMSPVKSDVDILYASVVVKKNRVVGRHDEANATDIIYSAVADQHHQRI